LLEVDGERQPVIMAQIKTLIALQDNPHFSVVELG
jgi:Rho-binding antiterminator